MRTRVIGLAMFAVGVVMVAAMGASAASQANPTKLAGTLSGKVETPKGDLSGKGTVSVTLNTKTGRVCWKFAISKIDGAASAAHIHKGAKGVAGAVVVPLGVTYKKSGCVMAPKSTVAAIAAKPAAYYVNVHNAKHAAGALRSQLHRAM